MVFCSSCAPDAGDEAEMPNFRICIDCQKRERLQPLDVLQARYQTTMLHGHLERYFTESLGWFPCTESANIQNIQGLPSWSWTSRDGPVDWTSSSTYGNETFLSAASASKANIVKFFYSDPEKGIRKVNEDVRTFSELRDDLQRQALHLLLKAAPSWWPQSAQRNRHPKDIDAESLKSLISAVFDNVDIEGWTRSNIRFRIKDRNRKGRVKEMSENGYARAALESLEVNTESASWWPAENDMPEISDSPDEAYDYAGGSSISYDTALRHPSSLLFNTTCVYLCVDTRAYQAMRTPKDGYRINFRIVPPDGFTTVGITTSMSPKYVGNTFPDSEHTNDKLYPVFVIGACTAPRIAASNAYRVGGAGEMWDELCLQVVVAERDEERGVMRRLALGVVYPDIWEALEPDWQSIVLV
ncbi:hypothetical protein BJ166DRAFT_594281 [Pestalotiopsis sp. NC0098]|nr:hypothetical protein BJ166DRAFT_594281 [Pestalotiopsis sp. NC0098]